jgi:3-methylcrotonyl-CoA carboxylase beta subunit
MADESIIVKEQDDLLGGPPLVKAATGEIVSAVGWRRCAHADLGVADHFAQDDHHALAIAGASSAIPNRPKRVEMEIESRWRQFAAEEIYGVISADIKKPYDVREVIARIVEQRVRRIQGTLWRDSRHRLRRGSGAIRSASSPTTASCSPNRQKGAHFIELCAQRRVPLVFLQN